MRRAILAALVLAVVPWVFHDGGDRARPPDEPTRALPGSQVGSAARGEQSGATPRRRDAPRSESITELEWAIPMLAHEPPERQLETLRWLRTVPEDKVISAFAALIDERAIPLAERKRIALALIDQYIEVLEQDGVVAPWSDGVTAAQIVVGER